MFCELGSCAGQPRLLWFVAILHSASNATATRQLVLEVLHREPDRRQRQPFLGNLFVNCCPLAPLVAQLSSGHEEQHDQGELNPLLFDVVFINHGNRVAGRHCVAPLLYFTLSNGAVFCFLGGPARLNGTEKRRKQKEMSWDQRRDKAFSSASALRLEKSKKLLKIQYGFLADPAQPVRSNIATTRGTSQFRSIFPSLLIAPVITSYTNSPSLRHQISTRLRIQLLPSVQIIFKQH